MKITLVSSCGLVLEQDGQTLLIDALNKQYRCYYGLPPETFVRMLSGEPPYDAVCGILFTHAHPDHYSASRTEQLRAACGAAVVLPQPDTPERLNVQLGPFAAFRTFPFQDWRRSHTPYTGSLLPEKASM